jgi:hypothetical protein
MTEIEGFLKEKGFAWESPDEAPILIEGVFDPVPEISRMERQAAKFVSAEEEAEQRKRELNELINKKDVMMQSAMNLPEEIVNLEDLLNAAEGTALPAASETSDELTADTVDRDMPMIMSRPSVADYKNAYMNNVSASVPTTPHTPHRKRGSILETANPALINCLNNMFSPDANRQSIATYSSMKSPANGKSMPIRRGTMFSPASAKMVESSNPDEKKVVKTTRSKLLQRLLGVSATPSDVSSSTSKPHAPSFLDQLKARGKSAFGAMSSDHDAGNEDAKPKSFLDELKSKCSRTPKSKDDESGKTTVAPYAV